MSAYRYDFQTGGLSRISISHDEFGENGNTPGINSLIGPKKLGQFANEGGNSALPDINDTNRAISDDGLGVVFLSAQRLESTTAGGATESCVAGTRPGTSGLAGCQAYEWHECASGMCENGEHGEVNLISNEPGTSRYRLRGDFGSWIGHFLSNQSSARGSRHRRTRRHIRREG